MKKQHYKSGQEIINDYNKKKNMKKILSQIKNDKRMNLPNLVGKNVILNAEAYEKRIANNELSAKFILWYNENKNTIFKVSAFADWGGRNVYELEGIETWWFNFYDLLNPETGKHYQNKKEDLEDE